MVLADIMQFFAIWIKFYISIKAWKIIDETQVVSDIFLSRGISSWSRNGNIFLVGLIQIYGSLLLMFFPWTYKKTKNET